MRLAFLNRYLTIRRWRLVVGRLSLPFLADTFGHWYF